MPSSPVAENRCWWHVPGKRKKSSNMKQFMTNYRKSWIDFKKTEEYKRSSAAMKAKGILQPYRDNILQSAFAAAWQASGAKINQI